jgi:hypothetical protein
VLWGGTADFQWEQRRYVFKFYAANNKLIQFPTKLNVISTTSLDDQHLLLSDFLQQGPFASNKSSGQILDKKIPARTVYSVQNDVGNIWMDTSAMGLVKYHADQRGEAQFESIDNSFTAPVNVVSDNQGGVFFHDDDKIYHRAGTADKSECLSYESAFPRH